MDWLTNFEKRRLGLKVTRDYNLKIGRICYTCRHAVSRRGEFINCRHYPRPVWSMAKCPKWKLSTNKKKQTKWGSLVDTKYFRFGYHRYNDIRVKEPVNIGLGRACFHCKYRGEKVRDHVACNRKRGQMVWKRACCGNFQLFTYHIWLERCAKYMRKSGIDTDRPRWWEARVPAGRQRR